MRRITLLSTGLFLLLGIAVAQAQTNDHLKCYQFKDPVKLDGIVDLTSPEFGAENGCKISKAKYFCVPATKTVISAVDKVTGLPITPLPVTGPDPGDRICYKLKCPEPFPPDTQATDQFGTRTLIKFKTAMLCAPAVKGTPGPTPTATPGPGPRFIDHGDGTVTDNQTGLQWEQKTTAVGSGANLADPHDVDNTYTWNTTTGGTTPDGTAFTSFLSTLNGGATGVGNCVSADGTTITGGFAGHCDWRLPTSAELQTILLAPYPCGTSPCIDPICGPTAASFYWSSTSFIPNNAWLVFFGNGGVGYGSKNSPYRVRAVRGGS